MPRRASANNNRLQITPLFVFNQLADHQKECAKRWWSVMIAVIANLIIAITGMAGLIVTLLARTSGH